MSILKLKPAYKDYLWGGHRLVDEYGMAYDGDILAEAWTLSCHPDGPSVIENGDNAGKTLYEYIQENGQDVLGTHCRRFRDFPILIKFIDAKDDLSIQVHPNNGFALSKEGQYGKTEMWYVLDAAEGAFIYYGFKREVSMSEFAERIKNNTLQEVLNAVEVHKGDAFLIESGTIHAIGKGCLIAEIQQNSNVTYRVYDYGRKGKDGKKRDLHIEKALAVTSRMPVIRKGEGYPHIADCDYFTVDKLNLDGKLTYRMQGMVSDDSFLSILILDGEGTLSNQQEKVTYRKGDSLFLPAGSGDWQIEGRCDALVTTIREKTSPIRVGVDIGSDEISIGIVNNDQQITAVKRYPLDRSKNAEDIVDALAEEVLQILKDNAIPLDQCTGVGVGIPGTIDRKNGKVLYSNNIKWEDVSIVQQLGKVIPCPVRIANNADCAALGEAVAGAGKDYSDVVMFTLGGGVGGGIILNGSVFEGGIMGGSEIGHMVIHADGKLCTCGRRGCLEAYASVPALLRNAAEACGESLTLQEIFARWHAKDERIVPVMQEYTRSLGVGIVNIINLFRPQLILLGGKLSEYAGEFIAPLTAIAQEESFGRSHGMIPEIRTAELGKDAGMIGAANL
ncbi:MAG: ROK family protein [Solobacterium sp.]|nr:ROK family protein [Solobacterium sp.]